jgi:hypothetical protein
MGFNIWFEFYTAIFRDLKLVDPTRWMCCKHEDLVAAPNATIAQIVSFLDLPFEADMLDYGKFHHADDDMRLWGNDKPSASALQRKLYSFRIETDHADVHQVRPEVMSLYEQLDEVRELNQRLGYPDAPVGLSALPPVARGLQ